VTWSVLQSKSGTSTTSPTCNVQYTSALSAGTKLIALVASGSVTITSVKDAAANSFTLLARVSGSGGGATELSWWAIDVPAADVGTAATITANSATNSAAMLIQEVAGLAAGNTTAAMLDGTPGTVQVAASASHAQPAYTSTAANEYLAAAFTDSGGPETYTAPAGYTPDANGVNNSAVGDCVIAYKNSAGAAESGTWAFTGTFTGVGTAYAVVAFQLAPAPVTVPQPFPQMRTELARGHPGGRVIRA
jgi:hypothetical protein